MTSTRARLVRRALLLVVAVAVAATSCAGDYDRLSATPVTTTSPTTTAPRATTTTATTSTTTTTRPPGFPPTTTVPGATTTTVPGSAAGLPGRLAVLALDGSLLTIRPDGTDPKALATASPGTSVASPTWTPDAARLVWTALGTNSVRVRGATVDFTDVHEAVLSPQASLFLPNPSGTELVVLRESSTSATELLRVDPTTFASTSIRTAAAVHATWSPDGTRLLVHAGNEVLLVRGSTVTPLVLATAGTFGSFGAGQWLDDRTVVVAVRNGASQVLVSVDTETGATKDLLSFTGAIRFLVDPARSRVAYQVLPETGGSTGSNVAFRPQTAPTTTAAPVPTATSGRLEVLTLATRQVASTGLTGALVFQWSPTGERLAALVTDTSGAVRWRFWGDKDVIDGLLHSPPNVFLRVYGRYFDDAAPAVRWWSPDGKAFVYSGRAGARNGVFVQQMNGTAPVLVNDGDTAVWSPR